MRRHLRTPGPALAGALLCALASGPAARSQTTDLVKRGEYLARAADCQACHSAAGGGAYAGGRAFTLPMGVLYSPNITPDAQTGIGRYTDDEFVRVLHTGVARGGKHLYPAMPYNSYTLMTRDDALAIKAYLFSLPAVHATAPANRMDFPYNIRAVMIGWNLLNNPDHRFTPDAGKPADWNRGAYLVEALGHCAQCHTPRTATQGLDTARAYAGAVQQGWDAYNLTSDATHGLKGWSDAALEQYLSTGHADGHGPASGPMAEAVQYSLRYLSAADIHAIVVYLRGIPAQPDGPEAPQATPASRPAVPLGRQVFAEACAGCHLPGGDGRQSQWAALRGDHSLGDPTATNMVQVLAHGSQIQTDQGLMFMHAFTRAYTDPELAAVANYAIGQFGGRQGEVTAQQVKAAREAAEKTQKIGSGS
ncbi:c-type cytochrome [Lichenicoccus sp.]|uniref:c-type cytochrome n=1 Tax=Lichenicoccus sp. TaxID=2781899 RepID=UPI003D09C9D7